MKILLLTNILPPYRVPLYNFLSEEFEKRGYKLRIAFLAEIEANREWQVRKSELKVDAVVLPGWHKFFWALELPLHFNRGVWRFLRRESPDVLISGGYSAPANWLALAYCKRFKKPLILWTSTTIDSVRGRDPVRRALRAFFIRQANAFVTYGKKATEYLLDFGIKPESIFTGCNTGDVEFFMKASTKYRKRAEFLKDREGWDEPILLYVGQLIRRKGLFQLARALSGLGQEHWSLIVVGNGPILKDLKRLLEKENLEHRVFFVGFKEKEEIAKFYSLADIFVLPSTQEPFGIVVSEALSSGLFTVCSKYAGAAWDLIEEGKNGVIVDPTHLNSLQEGIQRAIKIVRSSAFDRESVTKSMVDLGPERYARAFIDAVNYAIKSV